MKVSGKQPHGPACGGTGHREAELGNVGISERGKAEVWILAKTRYKIGAVVLTALLCWPVYRFDVPNPAIICLIGVVFSSMIGGFLYGGASGLITVIYCAYFFSENNSFFQYTQINAYKILIIVFEVSSMVGMVGALKRALEARTKEMQVLCRRFNALADTDMLTGIPNRRKFEEVFEQEWRRSIRNNQSIAVLMLDVDLFKKYNDDYGHLAGDGCLHEIAKVMQSSLKKPGDFVARYGGEEFVLILPNTGLAGAKRVAETIRAAIEGLHIARGMPMPYPAITVSIGTVCTVPEIGDSPWELLEKADAALYAAKKNGRNRVETVM